MRAVVAVYRGDQEETGALALGELAKLDATYSIRLVGFDVESLNNYSLHDDHCGGASIFCRTCGECGYGLTLAEFLNFAIEHDLRHA